MGQNKLGCGFLIIALENYLTSDLRTKASKRKETQKSVLSSSSDVYCCCVNRQETEGQTATDSEVKLWNESLLWNSTTDVVEGTHFLYASLVTVSSSWQTVDCISTTINRRDCYWAKLRVSKVFVSLIGVYDSSKYWDVLQQVGCSTTWQQVSKRVAQQ